MRFTYDNSDDNAANPVRPPVEAQWGQRSDEEMGDLWLQLLARTPRRSRSLDRDFRPKAAHEDLVGYEALIRRTPDDPGLRDDAAVLCLELNEPDAAAAHWRHSVALRPELPAAHFNLATALTLGGHLDAASAEFAEALRLNPHYTKAHNNLGRAAADPRTDRRRGGAVHGGAGGSAARRRSALQPRRRVSHAAGSRGGHG